MVKDQVYEFYPSAAILEVKSEKEGDVAQIIQMISQELKKLNIVERIKNRQAVLPKCQLNYE